MATPREPSPLRPAAPHDEPKTSKEMMTELFSQFHDFDDPGTYEGYMDQAISKTTANFAVRFGVERAEIAINLTEQDLGALLQVQAENKDDKIACTWINIWSPLDNIGIVKAIAGKYKFSTRLQGTIIGWDEARRQVAEKIPKEPIHGASKPCDAVTSRPRTRRTFHVKSPPDPEKGFADDDEAARRATVARSLGLDKLHQEDLHMYKLLQEQYNYTTIDHGSNFVCIGANWLHHRPRLEKNPQDVEDVYRDSADIVPPKHWAWYILTNEGTVISIHETPNYEPPRRKDPLTWRAEELKNMRKNTLDLLFQLSIPGMEHYRHRVSSQKGVRSDLLKPSHRGSLPRARTTIVEPSVAVDASSNLFFYLFEDYTAATSILSTSNDVLAKLTENVLHITDRKNKDRDNSDIIRLLYARSKDLRQLKHLFESYEKLIKGIMDLGTDVASDEKDLSGVATSTSSLLGSGGAGRARGVKLSQRAFDRFERLGIRLRLLMLDTIDEYLAEKASLSDTYFNLMSQNDSQATSKLNRSASLLAKLSVFFLPISFMTSYFSIQIPDLTDGNTGATYWVSFAVIATLSFMSLFFFGFFSRMLMLVSDVLDEKVHDAHRLMMRGVQKAFTRRAKKEKVDGDGGGEDDSGTKPLEQD